MSFQHTDHTQKCFFKSVELSDQLRNFDWKSVRGFGIHMNRGEDNLKYQFLKFSSKLFTKIEETGNEKIDIFLNDPNILSVGIITVGANSEVQVHKDHDYWSSLFYRIHIPLKNPGAYFIYGDEKIVWNMDMVYIFDVMGVSHGAVNPTDDDFKMIYIDITQNLVNVVNTNKFNDLTREYQQKFLETVPHDLIFKEYRKTCTKEELEAQNQYLDQYNLNLKMQ